ncbi:MAG: glycosyltransferase [Chitinophagaceae bacterium]|nr:MAG: glycosyltransferase [Chitinophagaceae bacterium]
MVESTMIDFCLLVPCFNNPGGLIRSLRSVKYDPARCMILVVDDGSREAIDQEEVRHSVGSGLNVKVLRLKNNAGITAALNAGLEWITLNLNTELIARLDCGDLCSPQRFSLQAELMKSDPSLVLTGSWCYFRDPVTGEQYRYITSIAHEHIVQEMYGRNVFMHPTVMYRADAVKRAGFYPQNFELAEDYALFWTLLKTGRSAMIGEFLVTCEISKAGISFSNKGKQLIARWKVVKTFGSAPMLKFRGLLRLAGLLILPKGLILWLKKKKA